MNSSPLAYGDEDQAKIGEGLRGPISGIREAAHDIDKAVTVHLVAMIATPHGI